MQETKKVVKPKVSTGDKVKYERTNGEVLTGTVFQTRQFGSAIYVRRDDGKGTFAAPIERVEVL